MPSSELLRALQDIAEEGAASEATAGATTEVQESIAAD